MICAYEHCGKEFKERPNKRFCSNTCRTYHSHGNSTVPGWRERARQKAIIAKAPKSSIWVNQCKYSGRLFVARIKTQTIHPDLQGKYIPTPGHTYTCLNCDTEFTRSKKPDEALSLCRTCSDKESRRATRSKRRARIRGVLRDHIVPFRVFLTDNWTCQICGVWTPRDLRGSTHNCAPEIDHKIPLCKGGLHAYTNVHCTCRQCNSDKGDKILVKYVSQRNSLIIR